MIERVTALIERAYLIESDDPTKAEAQAKLDENKKALDVLIVTAQRQIVIGVAREATLESYRR